MKLLQIIALLLFSSLQTIALIDIAFTVKNLATNERLQSNFRTMISSLLAHTRKENLRLHVFGDPSSHQYVNETLQKLAFTSAIEQFDLDDLTSEHQQMIAPLIKHFSSSHTYYKDPLFFLSPFLHRILPRNISRVIMLDIDLRFDHNIEELHDLFEQFNSTQILGIARENQPVYRHLFWSYRQQHPHTEIGNPPPSGLTGFNSGVLLLDLDKLRQSILFNSYLDHSFLIKNLIDQYHFHSPHLGDQDFYTLLSFEHRDLFYVLPCYWNRQLCTWWKGKGYDEVWNEYYNCNNDENVYLYHGNCQTAIPEKLIREKVEL